MSYTRRDFAERLRTVLRSEGYHVVRMARVAYNEYFKHMRDMEPDFKGEIFSIVVMEEGPEFELTEAEFLEFLEGLEKVESPSTEPPPEL